MPKKKAQSKRLTPKEETSESIVYKPTDGEQSDIRYVYEEFQEMREVLVAKYPEFNDRTLKMFLDDNQKRANAYVPSKEEQGKESWQANVFTPTTRNKVKAQIASIAKAPPEIAMTAFNTKNQIAVKQAEVMKNLVTASYVVGDNNPETTIFFDAWDCGIDGTKIKYDGYLKIKNKVKLLKDYDLATGIVTWEESEEVVEDRAIEVDIELSNFLIKNPNIRDVQAQPAVIWVEYYDKERFDFEFGSYKNAKYVHTQNEMMTQGDEQLFFGNYWKDRMGGKHKKSYEVVRYYNKTLDLYIIVANGVLLLSSPLLWGRKQKRYPFVKTIYEPFANSKFFWGNSLVNILMAEQDIENALINSMSDKTFRSLVTPMLIGMANKDSFDLEDEFISGDTKIYVDNVEQVKPMPVPQVNQSEIAMLKIIQGGLQNDSSDNVQSGIGGSGSTAREIVIANERAEELKGLFFTMMKDLWLQKYRLRTLNIQMNYSVPRVTQLTGEDGAAVFTEQFQTFHVPNAKLSDGNQGNLMIEVKKDQSQLSRPFDLDVREEQLKLQGKPTQIIQITSDFLDDHEYILQIESDTMYQKSKALKLAMVDEKIKGVATLFPEIFMANKPEFFKMFIEGYGDDAEKFLQNQSMQPAMNGMPPEQSPAGVSQQLTNPMQSLPKLAGM